MDKKQSMYSLIIIAFTELLSYILLINTISGNTFYKLFLLNIIVYGAIICISSIFGPEKGPKVANIALIARFIILIIAFNLFPAEKIILADFGCCFCGYFLGFALSINKSINDELKPYLNKLGKPLSKKELKKYNLKEKEIISELTDIYNNIFTILENPTSEVTNKIISKDILDKLLTEKKDFREKTISDSRIVKIIDTEEQLEIIVDTIETTYPIVGTTPTGKSIKASKRITYIQNKKEQTQYTKWFISEIKNL